MESLEKIEDYIGRCKTVTSLLNGAFKGDHELSDLATVQIWREELKTIENKMELPQTVIAVVGDTGSGKSALLNALLDLPCVLPTSGTNACTAVVVEVVVNTYNTKYEADIHFLSENEWNEELRVLLDDLTKLDGTLQKRQPNPQSEAGVAFAKVQAVYGKVDKLDVLKKQTNITSSLGTVKNISVSTAEFLREEVNRYIANANTGRKTGQYWPVIKKVKLYLPECDVCSSGAVLVDLPGVRDANVARDRIAREYLKDCTCVWVVAEIHRAKDNRTAKEMLDENFRRQLLMDGQFGNVAFICTKTDSLIPSELKELLQLPHEYEELRDEVRQLDSKLSEVRQKKKMVEDQSKTLRAGVQTLTIEYQELIQLAVEARAHLNVKMKDDSRKRELYERVEQDMEQKNQETRLKQTLLDELESEDERLEKDILVLTMQRDFCHKKIALLCTRARNEHSMKQIKRGFRAGIRELKRRSTTMLEDEDEEDIEDYDDGESDDDDEETGTIINNLQVFCTSSTDYMKMNNLLDDADGGAQVFSRPEETQIPAIREYVHSTTLKRRQHGAKFIVKKVGHFVFDIDNYIKMAKYGAKDFHLARPLVRIHMKVLLKEVDTIVPQLEKGISKLYQNHLNPKFHEGSQAAAQKAKETAEKWGSKVNKDNKHLGGYPFCTYRAVVRRFGKYKSRTAGCIDFNEQLAEPLLASIGWYWDRVFRSLLWETLDEVKNSMSSALQMFSENIRKDFITMNVEIAQMDNVLSQIVQNANAKINEMSFLMKEYITGQQRGITRIVTPSIQKSMANTYDTMNREKGAGCFNKMKSIMSKGIETDRFVMFDKSTQEVQAKLIDLQRSICDKVKEVLLALCKGFNISFEPLWQSPSSNESFKKQLAESVCRCTVLVKQLYQDIGLPLPVSAESKESDLDTSASGEQEETVDDILEALRHDVEHQRKRLEADSHEDKGSGCKKMKSTHEKQVISIKAEPHDDMVADPVPVQQDEDAAKGHAGPVSMALDDCPFSRNEQETVPCAEVDEVEIKGDVRCGAESENLVWKTGRFVLKFDGVTWWCHVYRNAQPRHPSSYMVSSSTIVKVFCTTHQLVIHLSEHVFISCRSHDTQSLGAAYTLLKNLGVCADVEQRDSDMTQRSRKQLTGDKTRASPVRPRDRGAGESMLGNQRSLSCCVPFSGTGSPSKTLTSLGGIGPSQCSDRELRISSLKSHSSITACNTPLCLMAVGETAVPSPRSQTFQDPSSMVSDAETSLKNQMPGDGSNLPPCIVCEARLSSVKKPSPPVTDKLTPCFVSISPLRSNEEASGDFFTHVSCRDNVQHCPNTLKRSSTGMSPCPNIGQAPENEEPELIDMTEVFHSESENINDDFIHDTSQEDLPSFLD